MNYLLSILMMIWTIGLNAATLFSSFSAPTYEVAARSETPITYKIYVSPDGFDNNDGSETYPVETLARAQDILKAVNPDNSIEIHIEQGIYYGQTVVWTYTNGHPILFTPKNYAKERPVFDGLGSDTWFKLKKSGGTRSYLKFHYIKVQNYNTAMSFEGNRRDYENGWNSGNELYGMYFYRIGGEYSQEGRSTAAVRFKNSRNNSVINSHFVDIKNDKQDASSLHAIYIAHHSSYNEILRNRFLRANGDPIRVRDESNYNYIAENEFDNTGHSAYYSGWYCVKDKTNYDADPDNDRCTKPDECPSIGNEFRNNKLYGGYSWAKRKVKVFKLYFDDDYCGPLTTPRLRTSGNIKL